MFSYTKQIPQQQAFPSLEDWKQYSSRRAVFAPPRPAPPRPAASGRRLVSGQQRGRGASQLSGRRPGQADCAAGRWGRLQGLPDPPRTLGRHPAPRGPRLPVVPGGSQTLGACGEYVRTAAARPVRSLAPPRRTLTPWATTLSSLPLSRIRARGVLSATLQPRPPRGPSSCSSHREAPVRRPSLQAA